MPPPLLLKPSPYVVEEVASIPQPALLLWPGASVQQLLVDRTPVKPESLMVQPSLVCRVMALALCRLTPSMMSISPLFGQSLPTVQLVHVSIYHSKPQSFAKTYKAGQEPHTEPGM